MDTNQVLLIIWVAIAAVTAICLVAIFGGFMQVRRERLLTHAERMKALELGRSMPDDAATARIRAAFGKLTGSDEESTPSRKCFSTAVWVAFWGFMAAASGAAASTGVALGIAASVGAIGVTAIICGTVLAAQESATRPTSFAPKPTIEEDAFDVVSSRG
jgi:hypothetical protein